MSQSRLIALTLAFGAALWAFALAADPPSVAGQNSPNKTGQDGPNKNVTNVAANAKGETVRSARSLLGAVVKTHAGDEFGKIKDLGLDFDRARVTAVFVTPADSVQSTGKVEAVPLAALSWSRVDGDIKLDPFSPVKSGAAAPDDLELKTLVTRLAATGDIPVTNADGEKAGRVIDFGITPSEGAITYAVFTPSAKGKADESLYPIPLAAFVAPEGAKTWILELPEDILKNTPTFKKSPWPRRVPLAWTEYVEVRYGQPPDGGVQRKPHDKK